MNEDEAIIFAQGAASLALAASALAEAAQALSEAAAALSTMDQDAKSPSTIYQSFGNTPGVSESQVTDDGKDQTQEIDDDDASSVGANTGNNVYRRDTTPEIVSNEAPRSSDPAPTVSVSQSQVHHKYIGGQKQSGVNSLDGLLSPGRFYLVLEEEFDALPLILAYATAAARTVCYVPTSGSLFPWESIISAIIPHRRVRSAVSISGNSIMQLSDIVTDFASSDDGSVLVLRSTYIARANDFKAHSISDSLIFWGLPGPKFWPGLVEAIQQSRHTLLILSQCEYNDQACQSFLTGLGSSFDAHPRYPELNSFELDSILADFRDNVERTISRAQHSQNIQSIYEELLESPINDTGNLCFVTKSAIERADVVNKFIARVFLRGRIQDGTSRLTFNSQELQIPERVHKRLGTIFGKNAGSTKDTTNAKPKPAINQEVRPLNSPSTFAHHPGRWYIAPQIDSDVIPLICYLANEHPKSVCVISHSQSAFPYGDLFDRVSTYDVTRTGKSLRSTETALARFSGTSLKTGLCLLRGHSGGNNPTTSRHVKADALIYWGLPAQDSFLWPSQVAQGQFTHVYLIVPPGQMPTVTSLTGSAFQEHPNSVLLNAQGPGSLLHTTREKVRPALVNMTYGTIKTMVNCYKPMHPPDYPFGEFLRKVMLRTFYM
ncbi:unnamed protein product [Rhizoctonia solani]|uniref:Uncharacterized protein n=1 Tax=Rhizoctonia solani TaxID=456999 RepID=A0A8H3ADU2_9AGAM|nr:unnamed protein product [Rhizoctonia solani]